jgi:hypothetical protein
MLAAGILPFALSLALKFLDPLILVKEAAVFPFAARFQVAAHWHFTLLSSFYVSNEALAHVEYKKYAITTVANAAHALARVFPVCSRHAQPP